MDAASVYLGRKLMEMIREKQAEMTKPLVSGQALDFPDYKQRAGYLKGLAEVVAWIEAINFEDEERHIGAR
jgi:hypothetical protein